MSSKEGRLFGEAIDKLDGPDQKAIADFNHVVSLLESGDCGTSTHDEAVEIATELIPDAEGAFIKALDVAETMIHGRIEE